MAYPHYFIKLSDAERKEVSRKLQGYSVSNKHQRRRRLQSIWFSNQGMTIGQISKRLEINYRTIPKWFYLYRQKGINGFWSTPFLIVWFNEKGVLGLSDVFFTCLKNRLFLPDITKNTLKLPKTLEGYCSPIRTIQYSSIGGIVSTHRGYSIYT